MFDFCGRFTCCCAVLVCLAASVIGAEGVSPAEIERLRLKIREKELGRSPELQQVPVAKAKEETTGEQQAYAQFLASELPSLPPSEFELYVAGDKAVDIQQFGYDLFLQPPATFTALAPAGVEPGYVIGPGDEVRVRIWGKTDLEAKAFVDAEGKLSLPKIGVFPVAGITFDGLKKLIRERYNKVFVDYEMDVSLGALRTIGVFVVGKVRRPGRYSVSSRDMMLNALMLAGGPTKSGSMRKVQLIRRGENASTLDLYALLLKGQRSSDVHLEAEDTVFVPSVGKRVAVTGRILTPAIYELLPDEMELGRAIEIAGGIAATGVKNRVQVERVSDSGAIRVFEKDLSKQNGDDAPLQDGDIIRVFSILHKRKNVVYLEGNVSRPGTYELKKNMRIADLLSGPDMLVSEDAWKAGAPPVPSREESVDFFETRNEEAAAVPTPSRPEDVSFPEPYWEYALIRRITEPGLSIEYIPFHLARALFEKDSEHNKALAPQDTIIVFSKWDFMEKPMVHAGGAVNRPGVYPLTPNMSLRDLISIAGGLRTYASRGQTEILRVYFEEEGQREERIVVDLAKALSDSENDNLPLQERDHVFVRSVSEHRPEVLAAIEGEVCFPGNYPIYKGERLSSLLKRAGGFTELAYLRGAMFFRESVRKMQQERLEEMITRLEIELDKAATVASTMTASQETLAATGEQIKWQQNMIARMRAAKSKGRVVINLRPLEEFENSPHDLMMEAGDRIVIPRQPSTVNVLGAVYNQNAFVWEKGMAYARYVEHAGGATGDADHKSVYVIKADGSVVSISQGRSGYKWDKEHRRWVRGGLAGMELEPGDTVVVPEKITRVSGMRVAKDITQMLYQIAVATGVLITAF